MEKHMIEQIENARKEQLEKSEKEIQGLKEQHE